MLGLAGISERIHTLEKTVQRSAQPLQLTAIPALPDSNSGSAQATAAAPSAIAPAAASTATITASHASILSKLTELSTAFRQIIGTDPTVHAYLSRASSIESLLETQGSSGSTGGGAVVGGGLVGLPGETLLRAEEGVVLSAAEQIEASASMMQQMQALLPILEQKWPLEDFSLLNHRVSHVQSLLPRQAFQAAQSHVEFERYLAAYHTLLDFLSRQFLLWNQQLDALEQQLDRKLAQQTVRAH